MNNKQPSLKRTLTTLSLLLVFMLLSVAVVISWLETKKEVSKVMDTNLMQTSQAILSLLSHEVAEEAEYKVDFQKVINELGNDAKKYPILTSILEEITEDNFNSEFRKLLSQADTKYLSQRVWQIHNNNHKIMLNSRPDIQLPNFTTGYHNHTDNQQGNWRILRIDDKDEQLHILSAESHDVRSNMINDVSLQTLLPFFLAFPLLGLVIWFAVVKGLKPLTTLVEDVKSRKPDSLKPINIKNTTQEIEPLVLALNKLLAQIEQELENRKHFTSNASHEIRTPLAGIKTQVQVALRSDNSQELQQALSQIEQGVDRSSHLVNQLLLLSQADLQESQIKFKPVNLYNESIKAISGLSHKAFAKNIKLELISTPNNNPVVMAGDLVQVMLRNLLDNALRYTQDNGKVKVELTKTNLKCEIKISDNGPGIETAERSQIFERFTRGKKVQANGTGLGLSIVKSIVDKYNATIELADGIDNNGISFTIKFNAMA